MMPRNAARHRAGDRTRFRAPEGAGWGGGRSGSEHERMIPRRWANRQAVRDLGFHPRRDKSWKPWQNIGLNILKRQGLQEAAPVGKDDAFDTVLQRGDLKLRGSSRGEPGPISRWTAMRAQRSRRSPRAPGDKCSRLAPAFMASSLAFSASWRSICCPAADLFLRCGRTTPDSGERVSGSDRLLVEGQR